MTGDSAPKKYLDINKLALGAVKPGGIFPTRAICSVSEEQFLDMLRRAAFYESQRAGNQGLPVPPRSSLARQRAESRYLESGVLPGRISWRTRYLSIFCFVTIGRQAKTARHRAMSTAAIRINARLTGEDASHRADPGAARAASDVMRDALRAVLACAMRKHGRTRSS